MKKTSILLVLAVLVFAASSVRGAAESTAREQLARDGIAFTPEAFLQAVAEGHAKRTALFLEAGIDPSVKSPAGQTALWIATEMRHLEVLKTLLSGGVAPNDKNAPLAAFGKTIVLGAVDTGDVAFVRALVEAGADVKTANDYGVPPLSEAAYNGNLEMSQILLEAGADPNAAPGGFPLIYGPVNENHPDVVKLLLASGAKLGEHKQSLVDAAKTPEMRALLEAAE